MTWRSAIIPTDWHRRGGAAAAEERAGCRLIWLGDCVSIRSCMVPPGVLGRAAELGGPCVDRMDGAARGLDGGCRPGLGRVRIHGRYRTLRSALFRDLRTMRLNR